MSDTERQSDDGFALGGLSADGHDSELLRPAPDDEALELPRTALLAFRKSGGLRFTTRGFVLYRDGWVVPDGEGARRRHLGADTVERLAHLALEARLGQWSPPVDHPPDGYAYEVAARVGGRVRRAEVMTGGIPAEMEPLIKALERLGRA